MDDLKNAHDVVAFSNGAYYKKIMVEGEIFLDLYLGIDTLIASNIRAYSAFIFTNGNYVLNFEDGKQEFWGLGDIAPSVQLKGKKAQFAPDGKYFIAKEKRFYTIEGVEVHRGVSELTVDGENYALSGKNIEVTVTQK